MVLVLHEEIKRTLWPAFVSLTMLAGIIYLSFFPHQISMNYVDYDILRREYEVSVKFLSAVIIMVKMVFRDYFNMLVHSRIIGQQRHKLELGSSRRGPWKLKLNSVTHCVCTSLSPSTHCLWEKEKYRSLVISTAWRFCVLRFPGIIKPASFGSKEHPNFFGNFVKMEKKNNYIGGDW